MWAFRFVFGVGFALGGFWSRAGVSVVSTYIRFDSEVPPVMMHGTDLHYEAKTIRYGEFTFILVFREGAFVYIPYAFVIIFRIRFRYLANHGFAFPILPCLVPFPFCLLLPFAHTPVQRTQLIPVLPLTQLIISYRTPTAVHYFLISYLRLTLPLARLKSRKPWQLPQLGGTRCRQLL